MIQTLKLLLPVFIPAWNFFDVIGASPRIEYTVLPSPNEEAGDWHEFRPRPQHIPVSDLFKRLLWNAWWNETMYIVGCAERLLEEHTMHRENEIFRRIAADLAAQHSGWLRFRIVLLSETDGAITREIAFTSVARDIASIPIR